MRAAGERISRVRVRVRGLVQGVGFRPHVYGLARRFGLTGWVRNDEQGVVLEVQGAATDDFLTLLSREAPPLARIDALEQQPCPVVAEEADFSIDASARGGKATVAIGPDAAVCRACVEELLDPQGRRYRYPFLSCTHCGPRFTITHSLPYDRPQTSMADFPMCADCEREYRDPLDRRFHAQPIACPACGPKLSHRIEDVVALLKAGKVVALKGLGGFHLVCDAHDARAVAQLRRRKHRDAKPFAVMALNLASARKLGKVGEAEAKLLEGVKKPIVLLERADELAQDIAPDLSSLGVMLPYTPLHVLLFHEWLGRPPGVAWLDAPCDVVLVMTSANPGGEPLVIGNEEAHQRLSGIADEVVTHDRDILIRADDSVMRVVAGAPTFIRRARGFVPEPVPLSRDVPPVLAVGAFLKDTVCLTRGREAFVSQHVGDLDNAPTVRFLEETVAHLSKTLEVTPVAVAHDLHPDFHSTRLAESLGLPLIPVQHHHAHVAAVLAEHRVDTPAVGLALDGFGLGPGGEAWGGELLYVDGPRFERLGHLRPLRQPGGDVAARQPWRMAVAALFELGRGDEVMRRFGALGLTPAFVEMMKRGVRSPWTTSCGRLFDAACGLLGVRLSASYEGEAPMVLESLVRAPRVLDGTWRVKDGVLDVLPLLDALLGRPPQDGADVFHGTLAAALVDWALPAVRARSPGVVVLSGGCVMNRVLTQALVGGFARHGVEVLWPRAVPANDGGLSLGQAWIAARTLCA
ncbi:MAG: carbamoyltransferase HypF [Myxococcota bacterium]